VLFYDTHQLASPAPKADGGKKAAEEPEPLPLCRCVGRLGGPTTGVKSRIKDYAILPFSNDEEMPTQSLFTITGSSDGSVGIWAVEIEELLMSEAPDLEKTTQKVPQVGRLLGSYETSNRITCMEAITLTGTADEEYEDLKGKEAADSPSTEETSEED
jgi:protein MAK11